MPIRILLADDHDILRETLRGMLASHSDFVVIGEAADGAQAVELAERSRPDVAVVDIGMKGMNGIEATVRILRRSPETAVLMLTVYKQESYVTRAVQAGARGYLLKESLEEEELVRAIRTVREGGRFFSAAVTKAVPPQKSSGGDG
ncbi:MAG: response regulator transcription factor [Acidobacteriia bacterium]|nr:response regulator transcription factor [Terriglobia bacterium]